MKTKDKNIYHALFEKHLNDLREEGNYRHFLNIEKSARQFPAFEFEGIDGKKHTAINWCSNDYLGFSTEEDIISAYTDAAIRAGIGSGGTRNISGSTIYHQALEDAVARLHSRESALIFNSAFLANIAALATLGEKLDNAVFISDEENHASMIEGMRLSRREKIIFKHNNVEDLKEILEKIPIDRPKIVVFESVYSMSGTIAPIKEIAEMAKKYNALTYCDEVHAVGLYGKKGEGLVASTGCNDLVDIVNGTFAKAFGAIGGYIAGDAVLMDFIRSFSKGFIFTTSLPPSVCHAVKKSIDKIRENPAILTHFHQNIKKMRVLLRGANIPFDGTDSHITRILIGDSQRCKDIANQLLYEFEVYMQPIVPPTVPKNQACLRLICSARHTEGQMKSLVEALKRVQIGLKGFK